jgi:IclR family acetate operon transcriptional repressor
VRARSRAEGNGTEVQSLVRGLSLLQHLYDSGGSKTVSELAKVAGLAPATAHRLLRTLLACGFVRQLPSREYALGPALIRLGEGAGRMLGAWVRPALAKLVEATHETANFALLDGDQVVYVAQVPSTHSMRMFTEVGRRVLPHCTGVGKAILSQLPDAQVLAILARNGMPAQTPRTKTDPSELLDELREVQRCGYAVDNGEQEIGVRCVAVPVPWEPTRAAISVSGPAVRLQAADTERIARTMKHIAAEIATALGAAEPGTGAKAPKPSSLSRRAPRPTRAARLAP